VAYKLTLNYREGVQLTGKTGRVSLKTDPFVIIRVNGLPEGQTASITRHVIESNSPPNDKDVVAWEIARVEDGVSEDWAGEYKTPGDALAALQKQIDKETSR